LNFIESTHYHTLVAEKRYLALNRSLPRRYGSGKQCNQTVWNPCSNCRSGNT